MHFSPKFILSLEETAAAIGYAPKSLRDWIRWWQDKENGKEPPRGIPLPCRPGHFWQWRAKDVEDWVAALPPGVPVSPSPAATPAADEEADPAPRRKRGRPRKLRGAQ